MGQACSSRSAEAAAILDPERRYTLAAAVRELQQNTHILHADIAQLTRERDAQGTLLHELSGEIERLKEELRRTHGVEQSRISRRLSSQVSKGAQLWARSLMLLDPRHKILEYFRPGDARGPLGYLRSLGEAPSQGTAEGSSAFFAVWRPTSLEALRKMMEGSATGKGLNIKGKSARSGKLSAFVPFLQISEERHKRLVCSSPAGATARIYFSTAAARERAEAHLRPLLAEMVEGHARATSAMTSSAMTSPPEADLSEAEREEHLRRLRWGMDFPEVVRLDELGIGLMVPERLLMEAYCHRADISHKPGWETGRPSEPAYMDLTLHATRDLRAEPRVVVWQHDADDPLNPNGLLVAYEENDKVLPVASDIDAFTIGSRGVAFRPLPAEQLRLVSSMVTHIETILGVRNGLPWTKRWLEILKGEVTVTGRRASQRESRARKQAAARRGTIAGSLGGDGPQMPRFGFGDEVSNAFIEHAVRHMQLSGAVRHGAECFNFYFPQPLDEEYLVVWEGFDKVPWRYLRPAELRAFLLCRVADGFVFPLNPKWILCDEGWYELYKAMCRSPAAQPALDCWLPPESGLRERIAEVHGRFPEGFRREQGEGGSEDAGAGLDEEEDADLAELELKRYMTMRRVKVKLRAIVLWLRIAAEMQRKREAAAEQSANGLDA